MRQEVLAAIGSLPEKERTATTLFYINGYSEKDIAQFLEVPVSTVESRLHTSRKRLKERMITMVKDEFEKHSLPEEFRQRVVALAEIGSAGVGKDFLFRFASGTRVRTRIEKVIPDETHVDLLLCGPADIEFHHSLDVLHLDSFALVTSTLVTVSQIGKTVEPGLGGEEHPVSYEIVGPSNPRYDDKVRYQPSSIAAGPLDIAPDGCFGFVRIGEVRPAYQYKDPERREHTWYAGPEDIYVSKAQLHDYQLKQGDIVKCNWRRAVGNERFRAAVDILAIRSKKMASKKISLNCRLGIHWNAHWSIPSNVCSSHRTYCPDCGARWDVPTTDKKSMKRIDKINRKYGG